jgi:hypothetical protein
LIQREIVNDFRTIDYGFCFELWSFLTY